MAAPTGEMAGRPVDDLRPGDGGTARPELADDTGGTGRAAAAPVPAVTAVVPRRGWVAGLAGSIALSAYVGAVGLVSRSLPGTEELVARLPFHSPALAGLALGGVVAVPCTATAVLALRSDRRAPAAAALSGLLLVGWIVVEGAVIREFSVLQPVCALAGAALAGAGDRTLLRRLSRRPEGSPQR